MYIPIVGKNQPRKGLTGEVEMRRGDRIRGRIGVLGHSVYFHMECQCHNDCIFPLRSPLLTYPLNHTAE